MSAAQYLTAQDVADELQTSPEERRRFWGWPHPISGRAAQKAKIAKRLRKARLEVKLSQRAVADWMGVKRERVAEIEAGRASVRAEELYAFACAYGEDIEWLAGIGGRS